MFGYLSRQNLVYCSIFNSTATKTQLIPPFWQNTASFLVFFSSVQQGKGRLCYKWIPICHCSAMRYSGWVYFRIEYNAQLSHLLSRWLGNNAELSRWGGDVLRAWDSNVWLYWTCRSRMPNTWKSITPYLAPMNSHHNVNQEISKTATRTEIDLQMKQSL